MIFYLTSCQTDKRTALSFGLDHHIPTKSKDVAIEVKFEKFYQGLLRNLTLIPRAGIQKIYPTGSAAAPFYGTAKIHKLTNHRVVDELLI